MTIADFWTVVDATRALTDQEAGRLQWIYTFRSGWLYEHAARQALKVAESSGRLQRDDFSEGSRWLALDELCGTVGGAADVAVAVLVRDLIPERTFDRLTGWWSRRGLPVAVEGSA